MYTITTIEDEIAVAPKLFSMDLDEAVKQSIGEKYEGKTTEEIGVPLAVVSVEEVGEGKVLAGDPAVHYTTKFKILCWKPVDQEIAEGEVVDITEFGAFVRIGAIDGLVHISQVMDDFVSYDEKNAQLAGKSSKRILKTGDAVRARIISVSLKENNKVGLTMRQPFLGAEKWGFGPMIPREQREKFAGGPRGKRKRAHGVQKIEEKK
ncbi:MAG TPA: DNA-directed RNA polymerase [archaeon]|nr:DNA-directed RNA polymerase [archaeon]